MSSATPRPAPTTAQPADDRLDSWKEIAAFLHRDVRTVQRWEKQAGLPVHRHAESRLRTAYAYRSELDAWWRTQRTLPDESTTQDAGASPGSTAGMPRRAPVVLAMVLLTAAATVGLAAFLAVRRTETSPPGPSVDVLLSRFVDEAGDPPLAGLIEEAVGRQLARRQGIALVAPARVTGTLRLMRHDVSTPLTASLARQVAVRDGRIRYVVVGRIHRMDSRYLIDLEAINPADGRAGVSLESHAISRGEIVAAVEAETARLAADLLAAAKTPASTETLEHVTSTSLAALRLYTSAVQAGVRRQWGAAELLARRAIGADNQFASAYAWVGWAMRQQGRPRQECLPWLERAVALSDKTSDRETYFISGAYHSIAGNVPAAIAADEALLRVQPGERQAFELLIDAYSRAGRVEKAVDVSIARATSDPDGFYANVRAAHALAVWKGDRRLASAYVRRARELASRDAVEGLPSWVAWLSAAPAFDAWMTGDNRAAFEVLAPLERSLDTRLGSERDAFATTVGSAYLAFGKVRQAEHAFRHAGSPVRQIDLALLALSLGQERKARDWLLQIRQSSAHRPALFARVGLVTEAERGLTMLVPSEHDEALTDVTRGFIATHHGDNEAAVAALRRGIDQLRFSGEPEYFLAVEALARILTARGESDRALEWLAQAAGQRARTSGSGHWAGGCWIKINADLASAYQRRGRLRDAERIRASLRAVLQDADAQAPLVAALSSVAGR